MKINKIIAGTLALVFIAGLGLPAFAQTSVIDSSPVASTQVFEPQHGTSDQSFTGPFDTSGGGFSTSQQITAQTFTATEHNLVGVDLFLYEFDGLSETVAVRIFDGPLFGAVIGSTSMVVTLNPGTDFQNPQQVHFDFNPFVRLVPGQTFALQFEASPDDPKLPQILAALSSGNPYSGGSLIQSSTTFPDLDFGFVTYFQSPFAVKCTHTPVLFQPGVEVTIQAEAVDEMGNALVVDTVEIWIDGRGMVAQNFASSTVSYSQTFDQDSDTSLTYGCRAVLNNAGTFSGWKVVGAVPDEFRIHPIQFTGFSFVSIDFIFIPDESSYDLGFEDPEFLKNVSTAIDFFLTEQTYLLNQDKINFWIAEDFGQSGRDSAGKCLLAAPDNWDTTYTWLDSGIVLHPNEFQDCANRLDRIFSSEPNMRTIFHEAGHAPFGLADEYPAGGHFVADPFPNLYDTQADCDDDPFNTGKTCRKFISTGKKDKGEDWFTSDPASNDLMIDNKDFQPLDLRRINWMFDQCDIGAC